MSVARQHAEWLKLLDVSGPFLSLPVLQRAFPQGLEAHDPDAAAGLRQALAEWEADPDPEIHRLFVRFVLTGGLGHPADLLHEGQALPDALTVPVPEHGERLRPDLLLARAPDAPAGERLLVGIAPRDQGLEKPLPGRRWKESPAGRMAVLLRGTGTRVGLLTTGARWMLVDAPRDGTTGFATWHADRFKDFVERLAGLPEADGSRLLDHVIVVQGSGLGDGNRHSNRDLPLLIAGGKAAGLKGGRHIVAQGDEPLCNVLAELGGRAGGLIKDFGDAKGGCERLGA